VNEVGEHAEGGDQGEYFHKAPEGEEDSEEHLDGFYCCAREVIEVVDEVATRLESRMICDSETV